MWGFIAESGKRVVLYHMHLGCSSIVWTGSGGLRDEGAHSDVEM